MSAQKPTPREPVKTINNNYMQNNQPKEKVTIICEDCNREFQVTPKTKCFTCYIKSTHKELPHVPVWQQKDKRSSYTAR